MIPSRVLITTGILVAGVLWSPLPAASVTPAGRLMVLMLGFAAAASAAGFLASQRRLGPVVLPVAALLALGLLGLAQAQPWPAELARRISPEHYRLAARAATAIHAGDPGSTADEVHRVFLSLAPERSRSAALALAGAAGVLFAGFTVGRRRLARRWLAVSVAAAGLLQLLAGAKPFASGIEPRLRGTFVNEDHLAVLLEIALAVSFAWSIWALRRPRGERAIAVETRLLHIGCPVLVWLVLFVGLAFTGSRAGMAAALAGVAAQSLLTSRAFAPTTPRKRGLRLRGMSALRALAAAAVGLAAVAWVGFEAGFGRILATSRYELFAAERFRVWDASMELFRRFAFFGSGLGSFREAFEQVQPADLTLTWTRAHNDYLELLLTGGLVGSVFAAVGLVALTGALWRGAHRAAPTENRVAAVAGWGVVVSVGFHEAFDFGATLPANWFIAAAVLGAALAATVGMPLMPPKPAVPETAASGPVRLGSGEARRGPGPPDLRRS